MSEQLECDIGILLANLRYLEDATGERLCDEDAAIIAEIESAHKERCKLRKSLHKAIAISNTDPADNANPFRTTP